MLWSLGVKAQCWLKKISNLYTNFTQLAKIFELWRINPFLILNLYFYIAKGKQVVKVFLFSILVLTYDYRQDFLRISSPLRSEAATRGVL